MTQKRAAPRHARLAPREKAGTPTPGIDAPASYAAAVQPALVAELLADEDDPDAALVA